MSRSNTPLLRDLHTDLPQSPQFRGRWSRWRVEIWAALVVVLLVATTAAGLRLAGRSPQQAPQSLQLALRPADVSTVKTSAEKWEKAPKSTFAAPHSRCTIAPDGLVTARHPATPAQVPFLFNLSKEALPTKRQACSHCPQDGNCEAEELTYLCCGVCRFNGLQCSKLYPGEHKAEEAAARFMAEGHLLHGFTPCELFQRIRGRTLWLLGDSQTWHWYYALECFLREFAPSLQRTAPLQRWAQKKALITAKAKLCYKWFRVPPMCLELVHGTRVCVVRVDTAEDLADSVLPTLAQYSPGFKDDLVVLNTGLHYYDDVMCEDGSCKVPGKDSAYVKDLQKLADYRAANRALLPQMVWMDTPPQHFPGTGGWAGDFSAKQCEPLEAWRRNDPVARAGGTWNVAAAPLVPRLADAHLATWNASVQLWDSHVPGECTHWCHPTAYSLWTFQLNELMRARQLGRPALVHAAGVL